MARRRNRLSFDRLENRDLMSGDILASIVTIGSTQTLFITEAVGQASQANTVQVTRLSNGQVRVSGGLNSDGTVTRVNGHTRQDFTLPRTGDLIVALEAGDDKLQVSNAQFGNVSIGMNRELAPDADTVTVANVTTSGFLSIGTGVGVDQVVVRNSTIGNGPEDILDIDTGADGDTAILTGLTAAGPVNLNTGAGADQAFVRTSTFAHDLNVNSGAGADRVEVGAIGGGFNNIAGNLIVNTFSSITEPDADVVRIDQTFVGQLVAVDTGAGNDSIQVGDVSGQDVVLVAGVGNDIANLQEVHALNKMFLAMSEGNDQLNMTFVGADNLLSVDGGTGFDRLQHHLDAPGAPMQLTGWEVINGVLVTGSHGGTVGGLGGGGSIGP